MITAENKEIKPIVIYIGPIGHSGSTVLANLLGQLPRSISVGELNRIPDWRKYNLVCTCTKPYRQCPIWTKVEYFVGPRMNDLPDIILPYRVILSSSSILRKRFSKELNAILSLYQGITITTGNSIIIESSKDPRRLRLLLALQDIEVHVVHLVRNPFSVAYSYRRTHKKPAYKGNQLTEVESVWKNTLRWIFVNLVFLLLVIHQPSSYTLVRYEDLVENTEDTIRKILDSCGIEIRYIPCDLSLENSHDISGGRWRFRSDPHLDVSLKPIALETRWRRVVWMIGAPIVILFGYFLSNYMRKKIKLGNNIIMLLKLLRSLSSTSKGK